MTVGCMYCMYACMYVQDCVSVQDLWASVRFVAPTVSENNHWD